MSEESGIKVCGWCGSFFRDQTHCTRDGQALADHDGIVERYRIVDRVGEGGMGVVYKAEHTMLNNRIVALKLLHREHVRDQALVQRFFREAQAASRVADDHIVEVIDFGATRDGDSFLVMEYLEGRSLREVIDEEAPLSLERAYTIGVQIAEALYAAHREGIVHRDLKPENIVLVPREDPPFEFVKLLDFGIAQLSEYQDARITRAGMILGTPAYMSPEQAGGQPVDERTDVYALGSIIYEMLVGRCPFVGKTAKEVLIAQLTQEPVPPQQLRAELPGSLQKVILRALYKDPDERPKTAMYLAYELRDALKQRTGSMRALDVIDWPATSAQRVKNRLRRVLASVGRLVPPRWRRYLWIGGMAAGMVLGVVLTLALVSPAPPERSSGAARRPGAAPAEEAGARQRQQVVVSRPRGEPTRPAAATSPAPPPTVASSAQRGTPPKKASRSRRRRGPDRLAGPRRTRRVTHRPPAPAAPKPVGKWFVRLVSKPRGAEVFKGTMRLGRTPLKVATDRACTVRLYREGYEDRAVKLGKHQSGKVSASLKKETMSWEVLTMGQLERIHNKGQISRFTYERRKRELLRKRDAKLIRLRIDCKLGQYTPDQCERQRQAIINSYK